MDFKKTILNRLELLSKDKQAKVLNFVDSLIDNKNYEVPLNDENQEWSKFSLECVKADFLSEPDVYTLDDIKTRY